MDSVQVREKPFALAAEEIAAYQARGVLFPRPAISAAAAQDLLQKFEALERQEGGRISKRTNHKPHLLLTWLADLVRHPTILDQVESLLGPNLLCWASDFFSKSPDDGMRVTWHQDSTYWGLSKPDIVTAWVAFTPSTVASGCLRVVPGSHRWATPAPYENVNGAVVPPGSRPAGGSTDEPPPFPMPLRFEKVPGEIAVYAERGDVLFHDAYLWHSAARATDDAGIRRHVRGGFYSGTPSGTAQDFVKNAAR